ncbi:MAG: hypothetical protein P4L33_08155 [Capsulimonadaceae bacterium]|nr:hypothetical protein [Capsulimonadaceae bacterium]
MTNAINLRRGAKGAFDVHELAKEPIGRRFALWALSKIYALNRVHSGPLYQSFTLEGDAVRFGRDQMTQPNLINKEGLPAGRIVIPHED